MVPSVDLANRHFGQIMAYDKGKTRSSWRSMVFNTILRLAIHIYSMLDDIGRNVSKSFFISYSKFWIVFLPVICDRLSFCLQNFSWPSQCLLIWNIFSPHDWGSYMTFSHCITLLLSAPGESDSTFWNVQRRLGHILCWCIVVAVHNVLSIISIPKWHALQLTAYSYTASASPSAVGCSSPALTLSFGSSPK